MNPPQHSPGWLVTGIYSLALALFSWLIVHFDLPDSLLFIFWVPCMLAPFFYGRRVYGTMIALLVIASVWVTAQVSSSFTTSLVTIAVASCSGLAIAEMLRALALTRARAQEALNRQSEESRRLAEMGIALLNCNQAERVFELLGDFLAQVTADVIIIINQATPDQQSLITRQFIGLEDTLWAQAEQLVGFKVIGKVSPIVNQWGEYFFQPHLQKIPGGFSVLAASEIPETVGKMLEKLFELHETFTIGIADRETLWGNVHLITRRAEISLPIHLIEAVVYQCFTTLSRIHAMQKLAVSNELLEQTSRMARVGGWEKNLLTGDDYWSAITREIHEVPADFTPDMQSAIHFYKEGENREKIIEVVTRAIEHGEPYDIELQIVTAKGNERWVRAIGHPEFREGQCVRLYGTFQDITERLQAEQALREQEQFVSTLNDITLAALESSDLETMLKTLATRMGELFHADGCYLTLWDEKTQMTIPSAAYGALDNHYRVIKLEPGEPSVTETVLQTGRALPIEDAYNSPYLSQRFADLFPERSLLGLPLLAGERKMGAALIAYNEPHQFTAQEIARGEQVAGQIALAVAKALLYQELQAYTEQLEAQVQVRTGELQSQYAQLDAILRSVGDAIFMTDAQQRILYVNPAFTTLTGYPATEVLGQNVYTLAAFADFAPHLSAVIPTLMQGKLWQSDARARRKDGRHYDAALTIAPVYDDAGQPTGHVFTHRDISQTKDLERARAQFITSVSHQFRSSLTPLKAGIYLLQHAPLADKHRQQLHLMEAAINGFIQLIEDIEQMLILDSGKGVEVWEPVSLPAIVAEVAERYHDQAQAAGLTLTVAPIPTLPSVQGNAERLKQALGELVENAVIFTPTGGQIDITVQVSRIDEETWASITVRDTGPGLMDDELPHVFDRFFRGHLTESKHIPGIGLGLSIAQQIAEAHGGRITVESVVGQGSTFTLWIRATVLQEDM